MFLQNKLTETLISFCGKEVAAELKIFVLSTLEKHQHFCVEALGLRPMTPENLRFLKQIRKTLNKW